MSDPTTDPTPTDLSEYPLAEQPPMDDDAGGPTADKEDGTDAETDDLFVQGGD